MDEIEINGLFYVPRPKPKMPKHLAGLFIAADMLGGGGFFNTGKDTSLDVNIVEEYKLILQKKCKLSRRERDWVEATFHSTYMQIVSKNSTQDNKLR